MASTADRADKKAKGREKYRRTQAQRVERQRRQRARANEELERLRKDRKDQEAREARESGAGTGRLVAARLVHLWGLITVVVSAFVLVVTVVYAAREFGSELAGFPGHVHWGGVAVAAVAVVGGLGGVGATGWLAFGGLRVLVCRVAGRTVRLWPKNRGLAGSGGGVWFGGGGHGGHGGGGHGGC